MPYVGKTDWKNNDMVEATDMNRIELGIKTNSEDFISLAAMFSSHSTNKNNPHNVTKSQVGLGNVPNVATDDQTVTHTQAGILSNLTSGEKISLAFGKIRKAIADLISHIANKSNPHTVTKAQVGLDNVDNTSDTNKPISIATQAELNLKADLTAFNSHKNDKDNPHSVTVTQVGAAPASHTHTKAQVGLGNVDNTSDANKPVSTATQAALNNKVDKVTGKGLSTNDYTTAEKNKLANMQMIENYELGYGGLFTRSFCVKIGDKLRKHWGDHNDAADPGEHAVIECAAPVPVGVLLLGLGWLREPDSNVWELDMEEMENLMDPSNPDFITKLAFRNISGEKRSLGNWSFEYFKVHGL